MKNTGLLFLLLFAFTSVIAQDKAKSVLTDEEISEISSKLSMKLLLNDNQKSGVTNLLNIYRTEFDIITTNSSESKYKSKEELISAINSQFTALFDSKQKMKYDVVKKEWWELITSEQND
ncbi:MAG: hypothetical protein ACHQLA_05815 [Ignavibacteriales bacterium]